MVKYLPFLCLFACGIDRDIPNLTEVELTDLQEYIRIDSLHSITISDENEIGEALLMCLQFVDLSSKEPLRNQPIHFYHADADGEYRPSAPVDETTARLSGNAATDSEGRIFLKTTLPGDYGSSTDNRHIHTTVFGAHPEAYDIHFNQYTGFMGTRFISGSDQHFLAHLKKDKSGNLISFLTVEVKNPNFLP